ncbi:MAG TPA: hypothetical protein VGH11_14740 [Jatrophihabitans sp.]
MNPGQGCGQLPVSSGPASSIAQVHLTGPATAAPGATISVQATLKVTTGGPRIVTGPSLSSLLITQGNRVVGKSGGARPDYLMPLPLPSGSVKPLQVVPTSITLTACASAAAGSGAAALPAGSYALVAVLGYHVDALNNAADGGPGPATGSNPATGGTFYLVSDPLPITVG